MSDPTSDGLIQISSKELYDEVRAIKSGVDDVKLTLSPLPTRVDKLEGRVDHLDSRQDATERKLAWVFGAGAALAFTGGLLGSWLPRIG